MTDATLADGKSSFSCRIIFGGKNWEKRHRGLVAMASVNK